MYPVAVAVMVFEPAPIPVRTELPTICPAGMKTGFGKVLRLPLPTADKVMVRPPGGAACWRIM